MKTAFTRVALLLTAIGSAALAAPARLPDAKTLEKESAKQVIRSKQVIEQASKQAPHIKLGVPSVDLPSPALVVDPAAVAEKYVDVGRQKEADLFVMISFSMPAESIDRLARHAQKAGATLVLRGVVNDSLGKTAELVAAFVHKYPGAQFQVDPTLFKRFAVKSVPTFVLAGPAPDKTLCDKNCDGRDTFASVTGDVTVEYALEYLERHAEAPFGGIAAKRLRRVRGNG